MNKINSVVLESLKSYLSVNKVSSRGWTLVFEASLTE